MLNKESEWWSLRGVKCVDERGEGLENMQKTCIRWEHGPITRVTGWKLDSGCSNAEDVVVVWAEVGVCCFHFLNGQGSKLIRLVI